MYVLLFRKYAKTMVYLSIYFSLGCSAAWAILCLAFGAVPFGIILLIVTVISAFFYWWIRNQLAMCAKLMSVAGRPLGCTTQRHVLLAGAWGARRYARASHRRAPATHGEQGKVGWPVPQTPQEPYCGHTGAAGQSHTARTHIHLHHLLLLRIQAQGDGY